MPINERRKRLRLGTVDIAHLAQYNQLLRYVFQVTSRDLQRSGYEEGELIQSKNPILERADVIGWFEDDKLVSQLSVYPCKVNIHGSIFRMGGLTGVGTYPEYMNLRLMSDLIRMALERMRERQQWISYLYPYSIPYYRRKGWEIISDRLSFTLSDAQLPAVIEVPGFVERRPVEHADVFDTYDRFARATHGALIRGAAEWQEYWRWENEEERTAAIYYEQNGRSQGYLLYWIEDDVFHIKDMIYLTQEARIGLWNFISLHFSMIERVRGNVFKNPPLAFLLDDSQIVETIEPYYMARIVDVAAFIDNYPFAAAGKPFHFVLSDPMAEWNNGIFGVQWQRKKAKVTAEASGRPVSTDIRTLTAMLMGYRRPAYFHEINRLECDTATLALLDDIIPEESAYFSDYF